MSRNHAALGREQAALRRRCLDRDGWRCARCGSPCDLEMHHVKALADGGGNELSNVEMQCASCHIETHRDDRDPDRAAWRRLLWDSV